MATVTVKIGDFHYQQGDGKKVKARQGDTLTEGASGTQIPPTEVARGVAIGAFYTSKAAGHAYALANSLAGTGFEGGLAQIVDPGP